MSTPGPVRRVSSLLLVMSLLFPFFAAATRTYAQESSFVMTGAIRSCEGAGVNLYWTSTGDFISLNVTQVNSGAGTSFSLDATFYARPDGWEFEASVEGIDAVQVDASLSNGSVYHYKADLTTCDVEVSPVGGSVTVPGPDPDPDPDPDPVPPSVAVTGVYLTCGDAGGFGFSYSANREFRFVITVLDGDSALAAGDPFVSQSGNAYFSWPNQGSLDIEVIAYEVTDTSAESPILGFSDEITCDTEPEPPGETPTPITSPTPTQTPTPITSPTPTQTPTPTQPAQPTPTQIASPTQTPQPSPPQTPTPTHTPQPAPTQVPTPAPTPVPIIIHFEVPEPSGGNWTVPVASSSSMPGDRVRINVAPAGSPEDWVVFTIPDPRDGAPRFDTEREADAFHVFLGTAPLIGGLFYGEPPNIPTIMVETMRKEPVLIQQVDKSSSGRARTSLGSLLGDDDSDGIRIAKQVMVVVSVVAVGTAAGGVFVTAVGPWGKVPAGTIFLAAASQDPVGYEPIFHFFAAPGEEWYLPPLPPGTYLLKLETMDGETHQFPFTLTDDPTESLLFLPNADGDWVVIVANDERMVTSLPETGAGSQPGMPILIFGLAAIGFGTMAAGIRLVPAPSRKR